MFALMIFGTGGSGVQVKCVMIQSQVWSTHRKIKRPSRKTTITLRTGANWMGWNLMNEWKVIQWGQ